MAADTAFETLDGKADAALFRIVLRLRGGSDKHKSIVVSRRPGEERNQPSELVVDSFWGPRGLAENTPTFIAELDRKHSNRALSLFEGDLHNLLVLERRLQRSRRLMRQYNGSVQDGRQL
jgi:hypothetical protein